MSYSTESWPLLMFFLHPPYIVGPLSLGVLNFKNENGYVCRYYTSNLQSNPFGRWKCACSDSSEGSLREMQS